MSESSVVFLRGMNLGNRRITNDELVEIFAAAGHPDAAAYQASGNVLIGAATVDAPALERLLSDRFGGDVPVFVRTATEVAAIVDGSPIAGRTGVDGGKPQVVFLDHAPHSAPPALFPDDHEVHAIGTELHWLPPGGLAGLGPLQNRMDRALGPTTVRTLGTVERIHQRL